MNSTQKINRERAKRGFSEMGYEEFSRHFQSRTRAATLRPMFFDPKRLNDERRMLIREMDIASVLPK